jgi:predicted nuclease of predicted toxin-antitoxin system
MNIVIDMNLSPNWVATLANAGHVVRHWSTIGAPNATDREILIWARDNDHVVFTHDLDFGAILAATSADAPSVIQIRTQDPTPQRCQSAILDTLKRHAAMLANGALVSVDENRSRVRLLPLHF